MGNNSTKNKTDGRFPYAKKSGAVEEKKEPAFEVDCGANAKVPPRLTLKEHTRLGILKFELRGDEVYANGRKVELVSCADPKTNAMLERDVVLTQVLAGRRPLNSCARDFFAENGKAIPGSWKKKSIFFPATTFGAPNGDPCIPCLYDNCGWSWSDLMMGKHDVFGKNAYIAVI
ncbi:MAG: hypothetical protein AAB920_02225 [Patescibacteria group bacterium]